jgi:hypothetical protein
MQSGNDEKLAVVLNKMERIVLDFHQRCSLSYWWGQAFLDMVSHPDFKPELLQLRHLSGPLRILRQLRTTFGSQGTEIRDWSRCCDFFNIFREIMRDPH